MREIYLESEDCIYNCPYCGAEIGDYTDDRIKTHTEYCGFCFKEFLIVVEDKK